MFVSDDPEYAPVTENNFPEFYGHDKELTKKFVRTFDQYSLGKNVLPNYAKDKAFFKRWFQTNSPHKSQIFTVFPNS